MFLVARTFAVMSSDRVFCLGSLGLMTFAGLIMMALSFTGH